MDKVVTKGVANLWINWKRIGARGRPTCHKILSQRRHAKGRAVTVFALQVDFVLP